MSDERYKKDFVDLARHIAGDTEHHLPATLRLHQERIRLRLLLLPMLINGIFTLFVQLWGKESGVEPGSIVQSWAAFGVMSFLHLAYLLPAGVARIRIFGDGLRFAQQWVHYLRIRLRSIWLIFAGLIAGAYGLVCISYESAELWARIAITVFLTLIASWVIYNKVVESYKACLREAEAALKN